MSEELSTILSFLALSDSVRLAEASVMNQIGYYGKAVPVMPDLIRHVLILAD